MYCPNYWVPLVIQVWMFHYGFDFKAHWRLGCEGALGVKCNKNAQEKHPAVAVTETRKNQHIFHKSQVVCGYSNSLQRKPNSTR